MRSDKQDGPFQERYDNGQLKEEGTLKDGVRHGLWMSYYESGELRSKITWEKGLRSGPYEHYAKDGRVTGRGNYRSSPPSKKGGAAQLKGPVPLQNRTPPSKPKTPTKTDSTRSREPFEYTGAPHMGGPLGSREKSKRKKGPVYLGSGKKGKFDNWVYHKESCGWAARLNTDELVEFSSVKAARFRGYNPCKWCKPPEK
mgnify:CR=1 FL=1|tara:strand:+ start:267 stop:863 length:597 start_codon:yes stop_codon:yes gene_type:complete